MYKYFFIALVLFLPLRAHAADIIVTPPDHMPGVGEEFYVDVSLDAQGSSINGIESSITFTLNTLSFIRAEDGSSIVPLWIERPLMRGQAISLTGIIPNGFEGLIDPFETHTKGTGKVVRLVFKAIAPGSAAVTAHTTLTTNDGDGTVQGPADTGVSFMIASRTQNNSYVVADTIAPALNASHVREPSLFDNAYTLVFSATDKESGIAYVEVREKKSSWKKIESPYRLEDQSDNATLQVRAVDYAGNHTTVVIGDRFGGRTLVEYLILAALLLGGFPFMVFYYRRYASTKR